MKFSKAVLKNGMISGSGFMNSGNVRCGSSVCKPITGIFLKNPLPNGYVHVTTIPAAASNITITELRDSINLLGNKKCIFMLIFIILCVCFIFFIIKNSIKINGVWISHKWKFFICTDWSNEIWGSGYGI